MANGAARWLVSCAAMAAAVAGCKKSGLSLEPLPVTTSPVLEGSSTEPVTLRFKFTAGQNQRYDITARAKARVEADEQKEEVGMTTAMQATFVVDAVASNGDASARMRFDRISMELSGPQAMSFDTAKPESALDPVGRVFGPMIGVDIPLTVTPLGEVRDTDLGPLIRAAGAGSDVIAALADQSFQYAFAHLSEAPVRAGDVFEAGTIRGNLSGTAGGTMDARLRYRVTAVSGDRRLVLLEPQMELSVDSGAGLRIEDSSAGGWLLFDVERGLAVRGSMGIYLAGSVDAGGKTGRMASTTVVDVTTSE